jgi:hypothetical protein
LSFILSFLEVIRARSTGAGSTKIGGRAAGTEVRA